MSGNIDLKAVAREVSRLLHLDAASLRDRFNGIAGISSSGDVLAPGPQIQLTRDVSDTTTIRERTSNESMMYFQRNGALDYDAFVRETAGFSQVQTASMKGADGGFPGLVAAPAAANSTGTPGSIAYANGFIYVCIATDTWQRAVIAAW